MGTFRIGMQLHRALHPYEALQQVELKAMRLLLALSKVAHVVSISDDMCLLSLHPINLRKHINNVAHFHLANLCMKYDRILRVALFILCRCSLKSGMTIFLNYCVLKNYQAYRGPTISLKHLCIPSIPALSDLEVHGKTVAKAFEDSLEELCLGALLRCTGGSYENVSVNIGFTTSTNKLSSRSTFSMQTTCLPLVLRQAYSVILFPICFIVGIKKEIIIPG